MSTSASQLVINTYINTNRIFLEFLDKLTDEQIHWRSEGQQHSIAFHAWHVARWTDHLQASIAGMTTELRQRLPEGVQIWEQDNLAKHWKFDTAELGYAETGMHMPDEVAVQLPFPPKSDLLDYVERVFAKLKIALEAIDEEQFQAIEQPQDLTEGIRGDSTVGSALMSHLTHANRHLGMMECLLGLQGESGSATQ